jgi:transcriptional regulator with XRE-family HTH domain
MQEFPNRIRHFRNRSNLTLERFAELLGTSYVQVSRLETGKRSLTMEWMTRIGAVLNVSVADLLSDTHNPYRLSDEEKRLIELARFNNDQFLPSLLAIAELLQASHQQAE